MSRNRCRCHRVTESVLRELGRWSASYWRPGAARGECIYVEYQSDNVAPACDKAAIVVVMYKLAGTAIDVGKRSTAVRQFNFVVFLLLSDPFFSFFLSFVNRPRYDRSLCVIVFDNYFLKFVFF